MSMSIGTPTLITISTAAITHSNGRRVVRAMLGSTTLSTGKASLTGIKEPRKNSTGQAHRKRLSPGRIFAVAPTPAGKISRVAARAIAQEQGTAAAPANSAAATGRQQRIVVEQASSAAALEAAAEQANLAAVVEQIEAALEAAAAPFKGSAAGEVRQGARVSEVARAGAAAVVEVAAAAVVEDLAAAVEVAGGDRW